MSCCTLRIMESTLATTRASETHVGSRGNQSETGVFMRSWMRTGGGMIYNSVSGRKLDAFTASTRMPTISG